MNGKALFLVSIVALILAACSAAPQTQVSYDPASMRFDGQRAYDLENEYVTRFTNRSSGRPNNQLGTAWLKDQFTAAGWKCQIDEWNTINYSRPVTYRNVVCKLPGQSPQEILVVAHHDQSPATVQGADNDGSGIAILLHLAEIFGKEGPQPYTLAFVATDAEEYGELGSRHYVQSHPNTKDILAGISLDNLGKHFYSNMDIEATGQFRKVSPLWLQLLAGQAARGAGDTWVPTPRSPLDQLIGQTVPISFMDHGPMVAAGIPAMGFSGLVPPEYAKESWDTYHTPQDLMQYQSADTLQKAGRNAEELIRQLESMKTFPQESGPYLYLPDSGQVLRGLPLWALFIGFVALFFLGSYLSDGRDLKNKLSQWKLVIPHFLGLFLPLVASVLLLYLFVATGLMDRYELYPATTKDPAIFHPRWPAVILFVLGLAVFLLIGRWLVRRLAGDQPVPAPGVIKSFALFVIGLAALYVLLANPFSLLFFLPLLFWFLIKGRKGAGRLVDILFFLLGGLVVYALFYFFGFLIQHMDFYILWFMMMMFSIRMVGPLTALAVAAIIASGLAMVVEPPVRKEAKDQVLAPST